MTAPEERMLSRDVTRTLGQAMQEASSLHRAEMGSEHILLALARSHDATRTALAQQGLGYLDVMKAVVELFPGSRAMVSTMPPPSQELRALLIGAENLAAPGEPARLYHLLMALCQSETRAAQVLRKLSVHPGVLQEAAAAVLADYTRAASPALDYGQLRSSLRQQEDALLAIHRDVESVRKQVEQVRDAGQGATSTEMIPQLYAVIERIGEQARNLTVPIQLPPVEDMTVRLVPSHWLERLDEYRSDAELAFLLTGLFGGALLGIPVNLATNGQPSVTAATWVFGGSLAFLLAGAIVWRCRIGKRASPLRQKVLGAGAIQGPSLALAGGEDAVAPADAGLAPDETAGRREERTSGLEGLPK